ncbi:Endonuclease/exonuclease/phosphatase [Jackrogersella minutella]|nr:Endonuclease/exonuclease/phosphatase [Jackrogersella minutella]
MLMGPSVRKRSQTDWRKAEGQGRKKRKMHLTVFQANVGKKGESHDTALSTAWKEEADVVLIQEPWTDALLRPGRRLTKTHPGYVTFSPVEKWENHPYVMSYVWIGDDLRCEQLRPFIFSDICVVQVNDVTLCNIYRHQAKENEVLDMLEGWSQPPRTVIAGDFNAVHWSWQPGHRPHNGPGQRVADWAELHELGTVFTGQPTQRCGNTLDLAFTDILGTLGGPEPNWHTGSDHETIALHVPMTPPPIIDGGRLRVTFDNIPTFTQLVHSYAVLCPDKAETVEEAEEMANKITEVLDKCLHGAGTRRGTEGLRRHGGTKHAQKHRRECARLKSMTSRCLCRQKHIRSGKGL